VTSGIGFLVFVIVAAVVFEVPIWVLLLSHAAMGLGTLFGGWRIVKTME
jgi:PiT family inorganic phosphate transporter